MKAFIFKAIIYFYGKNPDFAVFSWNVLNVENHFSKPTGKCVKRLGKNLNLEQIYWGFPSFQNRIFTKNAEYFKSLLNGTWKLRWF